MSESKSVYVIINDSYGEIIGVTASKPVRDRLMKKVLREYHGDDEGFIEDVIAGRDESEFIRCSIATLIEDN